MNLQVFADESGGKGQEASVFAFAGLILPDNEWVSFSSRWRASLNEDPSIPVFKMNEASQLKAGFGQLSEYQRDLKIRKLGRIINDYAPTVIYVVVDLLAFSETYENANLSRELTQPYFWAFHNLIMGVALELRDSGEKEQFEIIFDEHKIFGSRAKKWYPVVKAAMEVKGPEAAELLPEGPLFETDDEFLPLQAADLFAWSLRRAFSELPSGVCDWVFNEFDRVPVSQYSGMLDRSRMVRQIRMSYEVGPEELGNIMERVDTDPLK